MIFRRLSFVPIPVIRVIRSFNLPPKTGNRFIFLETHSLYLKELVKPINKSVPFFPFASNHEAV